MLQAGVEEVWVSVDTGLVVVYGSSLHASLLRRKIQARTKRPIAIVSDGGAEEPPPQYAPPLVRFVHLGPHAAYAYQPPAAYPSYGWVPAAAPPQHLVQYVPGELLHARHQYVHNEAPLWFNDGNPNASCSVQ